MPYKITTKVLQQEWELFLVALMFYTRIPVPKHLPHSSDALSKSRKYFPAIGILIGCLSAAVFALCALLFPLSVAILLSMLSSILATGAFHEDGFSDSCDGLFGGWNKEQVLTIMKDSRIGTYACLGLIMLLGIKFVALWELANINTLWFCLALVFSHTFSRLLSSTVIELFDYVQDIDLSKAKPMTKYRLDKTEYAFTLGISSLPIIALLLYKATEFFSIVLAMLFATVIAYSFAIYCKKRIDGYTGDTLGATQQLTEVTIYLSLLAV